jgi:hypothetical protein
MELITPLMKIDVLKLVYFGYLHSIMSNGIKLKQKKKLEKSIFNLLCFCFRMWENMEQFQIWKYTV